MRIEASWINLVAAVAVEWNTNTRKFNMKAIVKGTKRAWETA